MDVHYSLPRDADLAQECDRDKGQVSVLLLSLSLSHDLILIRNYRVHSHLSSSLIPVHESIKHSHHLPTQKSIPASLLSATSNPFSHLSNDKI